MTRKRPIGLLFLTFVVAAMMSAAARAEDTPPIKIGFGMALTGGLAGGGKQALLAMQMWESNINAKGGLLGRPVKLIYYDDQSNPATVPALYTKMIDVDKVDFIVSGYGTAMIAPAMPIAIQHNMMFFGLFGLAVNDEFHYDKYFSMLPSGQDAARNFADPFFKVAMAGNPKPKTLAILAEDSQFPKNASGAIHDIAKEDGLQIVYDKTYPPGTPDFTPIVQAIQAATPDAVFVASYPPGSVGMLRAATESGLKTKFFGGGMVGLQFTPIKLQFGPKLNGVIDYDWWIPAPTMQFPGIVDFLKQYQAKAGAEGVDPLGWYLAPFGYAYLQILGDAIEATKSTDQSKISEYMHSNTFKTIVGDIAFGEDGEWSKSRVLEVQWQGVKGNTIDDFKDAKNEVILEPSEYKTGTVVAPYDGSAAK
ncbi:MAG TPA: amino acid ABC transporter substrate-binding protein [Stellaceae bacterium]|jgi:branched-chain amino acid transport system substrate-binding protein|nr:amino acid ABC transporter substrate-binding protein [Stellaceae bacterium]